MDLIQSVATLGLLTLLAYFVMVNIIDQKPHAYPAEGKFSEVESKDEAEAEGEGPTIPESNGGATITNYLDVKANREVPVEGINLSVGVHSRTSLGEPVENGNNNITHLSVFNDQAKGILPVNHDLFEKTADFGSDITNINQFYKNNPEVFNRGQTQAYVPDVTQWDTQGKEMFDTLSNRAPHRVINPYNFEMQALQ